MVQRLLKSAAPTLHHPVVGGSPITCEEVGQLVLGVRLYLQGLRQTKARQPVPTPVYSMNKTAAGYYPAGYYGRAWKCPTVRAFPMKNAYNPRVWDPQTMGSGLVILRRILSAFFWGETFAGRDDLRQRTIRRLIGSPAEPSRRVAGVSVGVPYVLPACEAPPEVAIAYAVASF